MKRESINEIDIDIIVRKFASLLSKCWAEVQELSQMVGTGSYTQDWVQANWEMFVEGALPPGQVFLEVYGEGADCNPGSSRVYRPEVSPTHAVFCVPRTEDTEVIDLISGRPLQLGMSGLLLDEFVTMEGTWFTVKPPFDCVLLEHGGQEHVIRADAVIFCLREI